MRGGDSLEKNILYQYSPGDQKQSTGEMKQKTPYRQASKGKKHNYITVY